MIKVNMHEAKSQLSKLGKLAWQGEDIVIAKADKPYLHLVPYRKSRKQRKPDRLKGRMRIDRDFDETPQEVIDSFYDNKLFPGE